jgi:pSer/pThr/pTyr-binding forkhead associated (FHA) protein
VKSGRQCPNSNCHFESNPESERTCLRCGTVLDSLPNLHNSTTSGTSREQVFGLRFPFGDVLVDGILRIGRDPDFSPIAARIASLDRVSRRHAEVRVSDGGIAVMDEGSTNKVHVNGQQIPTGTFHILRVGDKVNFSSQLKATVIDGDS